MRIFNTKIHFSVNTNTVFCYIMKEQDPKLKEFGKRFTAFFEHTGLGLTAFANACGYKYPSKITAYKNGDYLPKAETIESLKKAFPKLDINWLLKGEGEMLIEKHVLTLHEDQEKYIGREGNKKIVPVDSDINTGRLAILTMNTLAKYTKREDLETLLQKEVLPDGYAIIPDHEYCQAYIEMDGDDMHPTIESLEKMVCRLKKSTKHITPGKAYLISVDGDVIVRRVYLTENPEILRLEADNTFYPSYEIERSSIEYMFTIHGYLKKSTSRRLAA
jgi:phage repressor protein C with HTH and peptisase S24 domain